MFYVGKWESRVGVNANGYKSKYETDECAHCSEKSNQITIVPSSSVYIMHSRLLFWPNSLM